MLRLERHYRHPVERVWRAIADPAEQAHWFPTGRRRSRSPNRRRRPGSVGTWHGGTLTFALAAEPDGCRLVFTHTFDDHDRVRGDDRRADGTGCSTRVDALLAGHPMDEARVAATRGPRVHERYAEEWGVDPGPGRKALASIRSSASP